MQIGVFGSTLHSLGATTLNSSSDSYKFSGETILYCGFNKLIELPELPQSLIKINCYDNNLTKLPELPQLLKNLWCNYNELTELPQLPQSLEILWCNDNPIQYITKYNYEIMKKIYLNNNCYIII